MPNNHCRSVEDVIGKELSEKLKNITKKVTIFSDFLVRDVKVSKIDLKRVSEIAAIITLDCLSVEGRRSIQGT